MAFHEHNNRSLLKTITYRVLIIISNGLIIYAYTGRWDLTLNVMGASTIVSTIIYFLHERAWNQVHWGKRKL